MEQIDKGIYVYTGIQTGKTVTIMIGVHGNEYIPIKAVTSMMKTFSIDCGTVFIIFANLKAIDSNTRFYQKDLNRSFLKNNKGMLYEDKRARTIMRYLDKSEYLLDIHNTFSQKNSVKFIISEHKELDRLFNVPYSISGFDSLHPGGSDGYMNICGKKGLCLEVGSLYDTKNEKELIQFSQESIYNFLRYTGNIQGDIINYKRSISINFSFIYKNNTLMFHFTKIFKDFEYVKKGTLIAVDGNKNIYAPYDGYILFSKIPKTLHDECFCFGKQEQYNNA